MVNQESNQRKTQEFTTDLSRILGGQQAKIMVTCLDLDGYFRSAWLSEELEKFYGLHSSDFAGKHLKDFYSPAEAQRKLENIRRSIELKTTVKEVSHFSTDRGDFWQDISLIPSLGSAAQPHVISVAVDISDIRMRESNARQILDKHLELSEGEIYGFLLCDDAGNLLTVNDTLARMLGDGKPEKLMARVQHVNELIQPVGDDVDRFWSVLGKPSSEIMAVDVRCSSGCIRQLEMGMNMGSRPEFAGKKLIYLFFKEPNVSANRMFTERTDTEFLLAVLGGLGDTGLDVYTREGRIVASWWPETLIFKGMAPPGIAKSGRMIYDYFPKEEAQRKLSLINDILETNQTFKEEFNVGEEIGNIWLEVTLSPVRLSSGEGYGIVMNRDITDRKKEEEERLKLERQIYLGQKMEAIGRIAAGIAHDFGNRLSVILGYGTYLKNITKRDEGDNEVMDKLEKLIQATEQAAKLTKQLLTFAQKDVHQNTVVDVHQQIKNTINFLEHSLDKRIQLVLELTAKNVKLIADENQIQNVFFNLILNAAETMLQGGKLTIRTENVSLSGNEPELVSFPITAGKHLCIAVADTGKGMDADQLSRIFEPFYSTKPFSKGTGLGLASVYGTVTHCNGAIAVESEVDKGSTFRLYLPISTEGEVEETKSADTTRIVRGSGSIFILDDEKNVLDMMADCLKLAGYTVTVCGDAIEALRHLRDHHQSIDLVLLDLMMPVLTGEQVYKALREINPSLKVLIVSAYSQSGMIKDVLQAGAVGVVEKPVTAGQLTKAVAEALAGNNQ